VEELIFFAFLSRSLAPGSSLLFYDGKVSSVQNNDCRIASYSLVRTVAIFTKAQPRKHRKSELCP
jgi:hypothetical protein